MRYFIEIAFDGSHYHGWQKQKNGVSVQAVLEEKMSLKLKKHIDLVGCGRTDTGVHAHQFFAHFDFDSELQLADTVGVLNRFMPKDIAVLGLSLMSDNAHARFSAVERTYKYYIQAVKSPFALAYSYDYFLSLDIDSMNAACNKLLSITDFSSFSKLHGGQKNNICHLSTCYWSKVGHQLIFTISANRFTRNMVRAIVGTMLEIGKGKLSLNDFERIIDSKNRCLAGESVAARGLFLEKIVYPEELFIRSFRLY
ncbi:MAG TPA: tRNA pseudouridine(38-40) synthase TruA [Bacteroidales bacterium]|nr:tRNA pseudouridine(38-40) synthase TruA [Bacteroidales bacterium]